RHDFFHNAWFGPVFNPSVEDLTIIAAALLLMVAFPNIVVIAGVAALAIDMLIELHPIPPQPLMWYRDDWPTGSPKSYLDLPYPPHANLVSDAKATAIQEDLFDRLEQYNADLRRWH